MKKLATPSLCQPNRILSAQRKVINKVEMMKFTFSYEICLTITMPSSKRFLKGEI
jgi:hypothetical protein